MALFGNGLEAPKGLENIDQSGQGSSLHEVITQNFEQDPSEEGGSLGENTDPVSPEDHQLPPPPVKEDGYTAMEGAEPTMDAAQPSASLSYQQVADAYHNTSGHNLNTIAEQLVKERGN